LGYLKKGSAGQDSGMSVSSHGLARDILLWFCRDLLPFDLVERQGFTGFFAKNLPHVAMPSPDTLGSTALEDVYQAVKVL